jgi:hypothetical protein
MGNMEKGLSWTDKIVLACIIAILAGIILYLDWAWEIYGIDYTLAFASLVVATIAATAALISLGITRKSLYLTRIVARPFLNIQLNLVKGMNLDRAVFELVILNTGRLPAEHVIIECVWFLLRDKSIENCPLELEKTSPSIIFPSSEAKITYLVRGNDNVDKLTFEGSRVKVIVGYKDKLTKQNHTTQRIFRITFASAASSFNTAQAIVIPEEDYWE